MDKRLIWGLLMMLASPIICSCVGIRTDTYEAIVNERDLACEEASMLRAQCDQNRKTINALLSELATVKEQIYLLQLQVESKLEVIPNALYYEQRNYEEEGVCFEILVAELTLENKGKKTTFISNVFLQDDRGTHYRAVLLREKGKVEGCACNLGSDIITFLGEGVKTGSYFVVEENVPRDVTGIKLILQTDTGPVMLPLIDASSIKVLGIS